MKDEPPALAIRFGVFEADLRSGELRRQGVKIRLQEQPFQALAILLERPGDVVTREELQKRLWSTDTFVDFDRGLNKAIKKIRDALGDSAESPRFIETLPQRGYRFIAPVEPSGAGFVPFPGQGSQAPRASAQRQWLLALTGAVGIAALSLSLVLALNAGGIIRERLLTGREQQRIWSIAVLPFENLSGDAAQEYFAVGMTEELIGELARIGSGVRVISRTSSMQFKGVRRSLPAIGHQLGADAVVEGTALRSGNKVRITAQLIDARSDVHLWSGKYKRDLSDVLILQGEVAQAIARQIRVRLAPSGQAVFARSRRVNPEALEAFLSGTFLFDRPTEPRLRWLPFNGPGGTVDPCERNQDAVFTKRQEHMVDAAQFGELIENVANCLLDPAIWIELDTPIFGPTETNRYAALKFPAPRLLPDRRHRTLPHERQLKLIHDALQPEQQSVVDHARIVDPVRLNDQRSHQSAQFKQLVPIPSVPRQT
jgi:TolB-like protein/DNA-binding winged helix-turn-helix (wHTH) protein